MQGEIHQEHICVELHELYFNAADDNTGDVCVLWKHLWLRAGRRYNKSELDADRRM